MERVSAILKESAEDILYIYDRLRDKTVSFKAVRKSLTNYLWTTCLLFTVSLAVMGMTMAPFAAVSMISGPFAIIPIMAGSLVLLAEFAALNGLYHFTSLMSLFPMFFRSRAVSAITRRSKTLKRILEDKVTAEQIDIDRIISDLRKSDEIGRQVGLESGIEVRAAVRSLEGIKNFLTGRNATMKQLESLAAKSKASHADLLRALDGDSSGQSGGGHVSGQDRTSSALRKLLTNV